MEFNNWHGVIHGMSRASFLAQIPPCWQMCNQDIHTKTPDALQNRWCPMEVCYRRRGDYSRNLWCRQWQSWHHDHSRFNWQSMQYDVHTVCFALLCYGRVMSSNGNTSHITVPFEMGIHRSPVDSHHQGPVIWNIHVSLMFLSAQTIWTNSHVGGNLRHHDAHV